jgi:hypothetical protein
MVEGRTPNRAVKAEVIRQSALQPDIKGGIHVQQWDDYDLDMLDRIQRRVLWLSTYMVHYANWGTSTA